MAFLFQRGVRRAREEERGRQRLCSICTPGQPSVELFLYPAPLLRRSPTAPGMNCSCRLRDARSGSISCWLIPKKPGCVRGCASRSVLLGSRSLLPAHGHPSSPSSPPFSQGLSLSSKLPCYKQKSCWCERTTKSHHLEPLSGAEGFQLSKKEGFCSGFDVSGVWDSPLFSPQSRAGIYNHPPPCLPLFIGAF